MMGVLGNKSPPHKNPNLTPHRLPYLLFCTLRYCCSDGRWAAFICRSFGACGNCFYLTMFVMQPNLGTRRVGPTLRATVLIVQVKSGTPPFSFFARQIWSKPTEIPALHRTYFKHSKQRGVEHRNRQHHTGNVSADMEGGAPASWPAAERPDLSFSRKPILNCLMRETP